MELKSAVRLFLLLTIFASLYGKSSESCDVWTSVIRAFDSLDYLHPSCSHNPICTGVSCTGNYLGVIDLSFGAEFYPCAHQLRVYVSTFDHEEVRIINLTTTTQVIALPLITSLNIFNGSLLITVQLIEPRNLSIRMDATLTFSDTTQDVAIVPLTYIHVPDCTESVTPAGTTPPKTAGTTLSSNMTDTGKTCTMGNYFLSCGDKQMCVNRSCVCISELIWDQAAQKCRLRNGGNSDAVAPATTPAQDVASPYRLSGTGIIVLVVCTLAAVIFASILTIVVVKYRRYRQRYGQHEPLINNEGDDGDLEVDADPPMLQA